MAAYPKPKMLDEITDFLANAPTSEQIVAFKVSDRLNERLHELLDRNANDALTPEEQDELDEFLQMDHFMIVLKAKTQLQLRKMTA